MRVFDLQCSQGHVFEGWFASEDDYQGQLARHLLTCPLCADPAVQRRPSAPRLNLSHAQPPAPAAAPAAPAVPAPQPGAGDARRQQQAAWMALARRLVAQSEDVGSGFAEEARRIHHGEAPERGIRGQASLDETRALLDEGIAVLPLPAWADRKEPLQ